MKKIKLNRKLIQILFLVAIGIILAINLIFFAKKNDKKKEVEEKEVATEVKTSTEEKNEEEKDPLEKTNEATELLYREHITPIGNGEEYPLEKSKGLKNELLELAERGKYGELLLKANSITEEYRFSQGINLDIAGIIYDAGIISDAHDNNLERLEYGEVVASSKTPEMLIASTLWSDNFARRAVIQDFSSLAPVGFDEFDFRDSRIYRNANEAKEEPTFKNINIVEEIFTMEDQVNAVYAYDVHLESEGGLPVTVYVLEDLYGNLTFYGMYAPDDVKTYEKDLDWWQQHDILYENAEKAQEEYYEENAEKGIITKEQVDKLFESGY